MFSSQMRCRSFLYHMGFPSSSLADVAEKRAADSQGRASISSLRCPPQLACKSRLLFPPLMLRPNVTPRRQRPRASTQLYLSVDAFSGQMRLYTWSASCPVSQSVIPPPRLHVARQPRTYRWDRLVVEGQIAGRRVPLNLLRARRCAPPRVGVFLLTPSCPVRTPCPSGNVVDDRL